jgi:hypothetical protein
VIVVAITQALPGRVKEMRYDGGLLYLNAMDGGARVPWLVSVMMPGMPVVIGSHDVMDWTIGLERSDGRVYELVDGTIRLATVQ